MLQSFLPHEDPTCIWLDGVRIDRMAPQMARHMIWSVKRIVLARVLDGLLPLSDFVGDVVNFNIQRELSIRSFIFR